MNQLVEWIVSNPTISAWITIISLFGVFITIIAFCFQLKDKKRKTLCYIINSNTLLDCDVSKINGIEVLFHKEEVKSVAVSKIKIWNSGNEIIENSDFYLDNELKITVPRHEKILAVNITDVTEDVCRAQINITQPCEVQISFYCLEPKQSISLVVYHTNTEESETKVNARIKGGKLINKSIEVLTENGELVVTNGQYKIYFDGGLWGVRIGFMNMFTTLTGITIKKTNKMD